MRERIITITFSTGYAAVNGVSIIHARSHLVTVNDGPIIEPGLQAQRPLYEKTEAASFSIVLI